jgi:hypothetical protein
MRASTFSALILCALAYFTTASALRADWIPTNVGNGADVEVRDHQPTTNFGPSTEIAVRVRNDFPPGANDGNDRYSLIYTRFDLTGQTIPPEFSAAFRLTIRNTNFAGNRIHDSFTPNLSHRVGLAVYGLINPPLPAWSESTLTYSNAPGIASDGNNGTKDLITSAPPPPAPWLRILGTVTLPPLGVQNRLAVGSAVIFRSDWLNDFISDALAAGATDVTLVTVLRHSAEEPMNDWRNFNYLFNPKEQLTLATDTGYDADTTNPNNPLGSPHSAASNASGAFSPAIRLDPVPVPSLSLINVETDRVDLQVAPAVDGFPFHIERSHGLFSWARIATVTGATIAVVLSDQRLPGETKNFYRLTH